jgi:hypothetical protein
LAGHDRQLLELVDVVLLVGGQELQDRPDRPVELVSARRSRAAGEIAATVLASRCWAASSCLSRIGVGVLW